MLRLKTLPLGIGDARVFWRYPLNLLFLPVVVMASREPVPSAN